MTEKRLFVLFVLSLIISTVLCQTFQYSRGWTNGKRSSLVPNSLDVPNSMDERFTGEPRTVKMLLYGDLNEQPLLIHCDVMDKFKKFLHTDN
ncbi:pro-corazonin [Solenopsis invicta]|uniref:pro-corazonin n=1 Tax=Solenopsis invicta TaxID=13686 RepID=UPI0005958EA8|nr:pro-corazonin [Solenopsis invicta]